MKIMIVGERVTSDFGHTVTHSWSVALRVYVDDSDGHPPSVSLDLDVSNYESDDAARASLDRHLALLHPEVAAAVRDVVAKIVDGADCSVELEVLTSEEG